MLSARAWPRFFGALRMLLVFKASSSGRCSVAWTSVLLVGTRFLGDARVQDEDRSVAADAKVSSPQSPNDGKATRPTCLCLTCQVHPPALRHRSSHRQDLAKIFSSTRHTDAEPRSPPTPEAGTRRSSTRNVKTSVIEPKTILTDPSKTVPLQTQDHRTPMYNPIR